ncbi:ECF transporter S component [Cohnella sp. AR92]|uniref:ECF transporter S component n=1 Tax=Cohnella sp. AR92 TaxID=648716 RepID=UPI000F8C85AB|nr:ECF transporter S component [Cohnella sp. AR92]RUS46127.1 thiamine ABC transporter permease [Cohnella sp. AR92]
MAAQGVSTQSKKSRGLKLTDILVTIVIAVVFGIIYKIWEPMYDVIKPIGTNAEQTVYGMWFIAGTFAYLVIRKPGVAILAEVAAASVEAMLGSSWGISTLWYGLLQGLGAEIFFLLFLYRERSASLGVVSMASLGAAAGSLVLDFGYGYIESLSAWNYTLLIGLRALGSIVIAGFISYYLAKAIELTGVTNALRPASKEDFDALNRA